MNNPFDKSTYAKLRQDLVHLQTELLTDEQQEAGLRHIANFVGQYVPHIASIKSSDALVQELNNLFANEVSFKFEMTASEAQSMINDVYHAPLLDESEGSLVLERVASYLANYLPSFYKNAVEESIEKVKKKPSRPKKKETQQAPLFPENNEQFLEQVEQKAEDSSLPTQEVSTIVEQAEYRGIPAQDVSSVIQKAKTKKLSPRKKKEDTAQPTQQEQVETSNGPEQSVPQEEVSTVQDQPSTQEKEEVSTVQDQPSMQEKKENFTEPKKPTQADKERFVKNFLKLPPGSIGEGFIVHKLKELGMTKQEFEKAVSENRAEQAPAEKSPAPDQESPSPQISRREIRRLAQEFLAKFRDQLLEPGFKFSKEWQNTMVSEADKLGIDRDELKEVFNKAKEEVKQRQVKQQEQKAQEAEKTKQQEQQLVDKFIEDVKNHIKNNSDITTRDQLKQFVFSLIQDKPLARQMMQAYRDDSDVDRLLSENVKQPEADVEEEEANEENQQVPPEETEDSETEELPADQEEKLAYEGMGKVESLFKSLEEGDWERFNNLTSLAHTEGNRIVITDSSGSSSTKKELLIDLIADSIFKSKSPTAQAFNLSKNENLPALVDPQNFIMALKSGLVDADKLDAFIPSAEKLANVHGVFQKDSNFINIMKYLYKSKLDKLNIDKAEKFIIKVRDSGYPKSFKALVSAARVVFEKSHGHERWEKLLSSANLPEALNKDQLK